MCEYQSNSSAVLERLGKYENDSFSFSWQSVESRYLLVRSIYSSKSFIRLVVLKSITFRKEQLYLHLFLIFDFLVSESYCQYTYSDMMICL